MRGTILVTTLAAAAVLLALPAAASAQHGRHGDHGRHGQKGAVNAAQACKAERQAKGDDAFKGKWGENHNKANAFGKCVSNGVTLSSRSRLLEFATGAITSFGAAGCNASTAGCALAASGAIEGKPIGHGSFTAGLTVLWTSATSNGDGGYCAPASGTVTLGDGTSLITESVTGQLCEIGPTGTSVGHVFAGRYEITSGTGTYATVQGSGRLAFYQPSGSNAVTAVEHGTLGTSS